VSKYHVERKIIEKKVEKGYGRLGWEYVNVIYRRRAVKGVKLSCGDDYTLENVRGREYPAFRIPLGKGLFFACPVL